MTGARMPVVRLSSVVSGGGADEFPTQEPVLVELSSSSKFGIAWPTEQPPQVPLPLGAERPVALSSSEGEEDMSEEETSAPVKRPPRPEDFGEDAEFVTPTNHLNSEQNPMDQAGRLAVPRLSRAFSMPLPAQLNMLQNPRRSSVSTGSPPHVVHTESSPQLEHFRELSLELADSVQMVIQTLLQLSPPQILDPAKEQFSACSLSIPTPSVSAMFTAMKNLNYMSANMSQLSSDSHPMAEAAAQNDFDVGEMLQSVGDALSGIAAQAGVDLVLFHSDVGMKHVAVKGDESGLSYTLSHVVRQIIGTATKGDTVEIGLHIDYGDHSIVPQSDSGEASPSRVVSPSLEDSGLIRCSFRMTHRLAASNSRESSGGGNEAASPDGNFQSQPTFDTIILRRLLKHIGATLAHDKLPTPSSGQRICELTINLEPGEPSAVNPSVTVSPEDEAILGYPDIHISDEPTLEQLTSFSETLRGKSVTLYASSSGSFAHHLSSYLTAWGMDVSHVSTEPGVDGEYELVGDAADPNVPPILNIDLPTPPELPPSSSPHAQSRKAGSNPVFMLIDDDVAVLRKQLEKLKAEQVIPLNMRSHKRPSLASNHRPRSSPQVARVMSMLGNNPPPPQIVIVHFTSLVNFKLVKDAIQCTLTPGKDSAGGRIPEVIVIPKPAGPRRFLTALHTAVTRPVVDPYFVPIATSPMSPGLHSISPFFNIPGIPKSPSGRSTASVRTSSDRSARSPKELGGEFSTGHAPPSPLSQSDNIEYFSDAVVKLGASPATGLLIQSPDGQPTGIFFHPKPRGNVPLSPNMNRDGFPDNREGQSPRHRPYSRVPSGEKHDSQGGNGSATQVPTLRPSPRPPSASLESSDPHITTPAKAKPTPPLGAHTEDIPPTSTDQVAPAASQESSPGQGSSRFVSRRSSQQPISPPSSPQTRAAPGPSGTRRITRRPTTSDTHSSPSLGHKKGAKGPGDSNIVPPISVLIVDDNPINQTILTTFMRKKKIKYDVAKNGEEAVQKWRSGTFHLILMDIQMPVMDGIQATKEIRRLEKQAGQGFPSTPQSEGQRTPSEASTTESRNMSTPPYRSSVIIVALTASSLQADRVAALAAGCNDFLTKPVSLEWLNSKIIEWGSIKALQMWADIRPEVVRSITTGQTVQAQQVARRLHVPEGRSSTPAAGDRTRSTSMASRRNQAEALQAAAVEKPHTPNTPLSDDSPGLLSHSASDFSKALPAYPLSTPIASMSASEAALSLASAHRPQASSDDRRGSADGKASGAVPLEATGASSTQRAEATVPPEDGPSAPPESDTSKDKLPGPAEEAAPRPPPQAEPQ